MGAYTCEFGVVHKMCRCPKPHTIKCDKPDEHGKTPYAAAVDALKALLWELPAEFSHDDPEEYPIQREFHVIKNNTVKVHRALWELQKYFGLVE